MTHTVLIVDDENDVRNALRLTLAKAGYTVHEAANGEAALREAEEKKPDIIVLDIMMPHMSGHQVLNQLRQKPWGLKVPVILLTNADDPLNISQGVGLHSDDYLIKSQTSLEDIVKKIKQHLAGYHD